MTVVILWHVDPLLGHDREIKQLYNGRYYAAARKQQQRNDAGMLYSEHLVGESELVGEWVRELLMFSLCELVAEASYDWEDPMCVVVTVIFALCNWVILS
jgi:hypothetical protein